MSKSHPNRWRLGPFEVRRSYGQIMFGVGVLIVPQAPLQTCVWIGPLTIKRWKKK